MMLEIIQNRTITRYGTSNKRVVAEKRPKPGVQYCYRECINTKVHCMYIKESSRVFLTSPKY